MNLTIDNALHGIAELWRDKIGPEIGDPFAAQMARLSGGLLNICANWLNDAVEIRVDENVAIRAVLGEAAALVDAALAGPLAQAAGSADPGLKISILDAETHRLRLLLVEAQAQLENRKDQPAQELDQRIWRLLEQIELQRAPRE